MRGTIFLRRPLHMIHTLPDAICILAANAKINPIRKKGLTQNCLTIFMHRPLHLNQDDMMDFVPFLMLFVFLPPMPKLTPFKKKPHTKSLESLTDLLQLISRIS